MPLGMARSAERLDRSLVNLDGTLIPSQEITEQTRYWGKRRIAGTKLSLLVDRARIPLALSVDPGNCLDGPLGVLTLAGACTPLPIPRDILPDAAQTTVSTLPADKG